MNTKTKIISVLLAIVALLGGGATLGSVSQSSEYKYTPLRTYAGVAITNLSVLKASSGTVGSLVITGAGAGVINIYDATSTVTNSEWPTTTIASFPASAAAGTYTFDIAVQKGILIETIGAVASGTITWR